VEKAPFSLPEWKTNFRKSAIDFDDLVGGVPKDGIPAIDNPQFDSVVEADKWLKDREPVLALELKGDVRAYPLHILTWHEVVNDTVGSVPVAVNY
jgi:hypothetical protein